MEPFDNRGQFGRGHKFAKGRTPGSRSRLTLFHHQPGQSFSPKILDKIGQVIDLFAAVVTQSFGVDPFHQAGRGYCFGKDLKLTLGHQLAEVGQFQPKADVGIIPAKAIHRLLVTQTRERCLHHCQVGAVLHHADHQPLHNIHHIVPVDKTHFHVQLGKFRLAIAALVLITEAAGNLKVAVITGDHNQLLQLLRTLR